MSNDLEITGRAELLRAYSPNEKLTALNVHKSSQVTDKDIQLDDILNQLDHHVASHNTDDPIKQQIVCQLQVLNSLFHQFVTKANWGNNQSLEFAKAAFVAQKLYCETAGQLNCKKLPIPNTQTDY